MNKLHPFNTKFSQSAKDQPKKIVRPPDWSSGNTPAPAAAKVERALSPKEELAARAKKAEHRISVTVRIGGAGREGTYTMPWVKGRQLVDYLRPLKLVSIAAKARIYDLKHPELGRRRGHYIPGPDAHICLGGRDFTPQSRLQRAKEDDLAYTVSRSMGGGATVVERPLIGRSGGTSAAAKKPVSQPLDDLGVDQL